MAESFHLPLSAAPQVTVALLTPPGRGAVATIRVTGDVSQFLWESIPFQAANGKNLLDQPLGRIVFGHWGRTAAEDVVVCRTSVDELEIHCHGGVSAAQRIMDDLNATPIPTVDWQTQATVRCGVLVGDCRWALSQATTLRTAEILLDQEIAWRQFAARTAEFARQLDWDKLRNEIDSALSWAQLGRHLVEPFQVVLTGPPNVGKSALMNALVGYQRAVVFDQPGTTRDVVTAETAFDGWPVRLIDTAGLRDEATGLEAAGIELARQQLTQADLLLRVFDVSGSETPQVDPQSVIVANKVDLVRDQARGQQSNTVTVSAITGVGIDTLIATIVGRLVPRNPDVGTLVPFNERQRGWLSRLRTAAGLQAIDDVSNVIDEIVTLPIPM